MLELLLSLLFCDFQFFLNENTIYIDEFVKSGEVLCINVTQPYAAFIFNTLGNSTFDIFDENYELKKVSLDEIYQRCAGFNFGKITGSMEIKPNKDSEIKLSGAIFPRDDCDIKLVSNTIREYVYLNYQTSSVCYFNGNGGNFRFSMNIQHGVMEMRGPNRSEVVPYTGEVVVDGFSPLFVYKTNMSSGSNFLFTLGSGQHDKVRLTTLKIISHETLPIDSTAIYDCSDDNPDYEYFHALEDERVIRYAMSLALESAGGVVLLVYLFSLFCICPCCCCYKSFNKGCCCECCRYKLKDNSKKSSKKSQGKDKSEVETKPITPDPL